jgi:hypothetical protein
MTVLGYILAGFVALALLVWVVLRAMESKDGEL